MPVSINGNTGVITGISQGGLPDGCITAAELATGVGGKILQVKQAVKTDVSSTTSTSFSEISDFYTINNYYR